MMRVIKTYGNHEGWSCTFRQWRADSHCRYIHGYALGVELEFACLNSECDPNGWVVNFGGLKPVKAFLQDLFDHKTLVAADDPCLGTFKQLSKPIPCGMACDRPRGENPPLIQLIVLEDGVGCDNLAKYIANWVEQWLDENRKQLKTLAWLERVKVFEHSGNAAEWTRS